MADAPERDLKCYSVNEVATLLGVGHKTIRKLVNNNTLPHVRIGSRIVIPATGLADYLDAQIHTAFDRAADLNMAHGRVAGHLPTE